MPSISQSQKSNMDVLNNLGGDKTISNLKLTEVEAVMFEAANRFMMMAKKTIERKGKVDTGKLSDMRVSQVTETKYGSYSIIIGYDQSNPASKYYDFQNKGVKGIKSNQPNSIYKYRTLSVSKNMVEALMQWYLRHKSYIRTEDQRKNLTANQRKSLNAGAIANQSKNLRKVAEATAKKIKKRGMPRVGFFDDNLDKVFNEAFRQKLAIAIGEDIVINIRQNFNGNNNTK
jgi:hypothetical protein